MPDDEWVSDFWRHRAINAVSVHIEGKSACLVTVPVAAQQLSESMDNAVPTQGGLVMSSHGSHVCWPGTPARH